MDFSCLFKFDHDAIVRFRIFCFTAGEMEVKGGEIIGLQPHSSYW